MLYATVAAEIYIYIYIYVYKHAYCFPKKTKNKKNMLTDITMTYHKFFFLFGESDLSKIWGLLKLKPTLVGPSPSHYRSLNW